MLYLSIVFASLGRRLSVPTVGGLRGGGGGGGPTSGFRFSGGRFGCSMRVGGETLGLGLRSVLMQRMSCCCCSQAGTGEGDVSNTGSSYS